MLRAVSSTISAILTPCHVLVWNLQVIVDETLLAKTGPHVNAPGSPQQLPPYSVAAAVRREDKRRGVGGGAANLVEKEKRHRDCVHARVLMCFFLDYGIDCLMNGKA